MNTDENNGQIFDKIRMRKKRKNQTITTSNHLDIEVEEFFEKEHQNFFQD
jgi:hypothetical protein